MDYWFGKPLYEPLSNGSNKLTKPNPLIPKIKVQTKKLDISRLYVIIIIAPCCALITLQLVLSGGEDMKRTLLTGLGILLFNIAILCCAWFAIYSFFIRHDYIIGVLFALLAVGGIIMQPWILILVLLNYGILMLLPTSLYDYGFLISLLCYPFIGAITSTWIYSYLEKQGRIPAPILRFWTMPLGKKLNICAISVLLLTGIAYGRLIDFPALNRHPPPNLQKSEALSSIKDNRTYCVRVFVTSDMKWRESETQMQSEWLWRADATQQQMDALCEQYNLQPATTGEFASEFSSFRLTDLEKPYWWQPRETSQAKIYIGGLGNYGTTYFLWYPQSQVMYAYITSCYFK